MSFEIISSRCFCYIHVVFSALTGRRRVDEDWQARLAERYAVRLPDLQVLWDLTRSWRKKEMLNNESVFRTFWKLHTGNTFWVLRGFKLRWALRFEEWRLQTFFTAFSNWGSLPLLVCMFVTSVLEKPQKYWNVSQKWPLQMCQHFLPNNF